MPLGDQPQIHVKRAARRGRHRNARRRAGPGHHPAVLVHENQLYSRGPELPMPCVGGAARLDEYLRAADDRQERQPDG
ncbi:hypothetical protein VYU27_003090 [Nannochloropsis oceanica]